MKAPTPNLRQVDDDTLEEVLPPGETRRPLQWRRHFNYISLLIRDPQVQINYRLHDIAFQMRGLVRSADAPLITAGEGRSISIHGKVDSTLSGDTFIQTRSAEGEGETRFETIPSPRHLEVVVAAARQPMEGNALYGPGTYPGAILPGESSEYMRVVAFDLRSPEQPLEEIATALQSGAANALVVRLAIQVFTYEVDDALREHYHPQTFLLHGLSCRAVISEIRAVKLPPPDTAASDTQSTYEDAAPPALPASAPAPLAGLRLPLWFIAVALFLQLFGR